MTEQRHEAIALAKRVIEQVDGGRMDMHDANILARELLREALLNDRSGTYVIWSNEHRGWWRPSRNGYSPRLTHAGGYTRDQALTICSEAIPTAMHIGIVSELPVRREDVLEFIKDRMIPEAIL